jgi:hypothetical protein
MSIPGSLLVKDGVDFDLGRQFLSSYTGDFHLCAVIDEELKKRAHDGTVLAKVMRQINGMSTAARETHFYAEVSHLWKLRTSKNFARVRSLQ